MNTMLRDISTMWASCFSLLIFLFLFKPRFSLKKTIIWTVVLMVPLILGNFALFMVLGPETMSSLLLLTCSLPSLIIFWILSKYRDGRFLFAFCFADTLVLEIIHTTTIIDYYAGNTLWLLVILRLLLCPLLALFVFKYLRPVFMEVQSQVHKGWYTFSAISMIFYVVLSLSVSYPVIITQRPAYLPAFILLLILMPIFYINIFTTLRHQQRLHEIKQQDNILKLQMENMIARVEEFRVADEKFRIERHNFRHKLQTIHQLVENGEYQQLQTLVAEYSNDIEDAQVRRYCASPVLDAVFAAYLQRAERKGIQVSTSMCFPENLWVSETELATVFANAIENAIHACELLPEHQRFLRIQVLTAPRFMIQISNSYNGKVEMDKDGVPINREEGHGLGTRTIVAFCEKNGALYEFKADESIFALRLVFC